MDITENSQIMVKLKIPPASYATKRSVLSGQLEKRSQLNSLQTPSQTEENEALGDEIIEQNKLEENKTYKLLS